MKHRIRKLMCAAKYEVLRRTGNGKWKTIATVTGTRYTDKTAQAGKTYRYTVRAVAADKSRSPYNTTGKKITAR